MREKYLKLILILFFFTTVSTEILGFFHLINKISSVLVIASWLVIFFGAFYINRISIYDNVKKIASQNTLYTSIIASLIITTAFLALYFPPNNWDSMTYHLSRVLFWINNNSVDHYATSNPRQLYSGPLAEYCLVHLYLFFNDDYLINLLQWFAYINIGITISLILHKWKINYKNQLFGVILFLTLPIAILESTTTQNDLFLTQFVIICIYFIINYQTNKWNFVFLAIGFGLALLTKATSIIFIAPFLIYLLYNLIKSKTVLKSTYQFIFGLIIVLTINSFFFIRNINLYGDPIGLKEGKFLSNQTLGIKETTSNVVRNIGWQLSGEKHFLSNEFILKAIKAIHKIIGIDIDSPRTTFGDSFYLCMNNMVTSEDFASNPFHFFLILTTLILYLFFIRKKNQQLAFILCTIASFLLFCFYLKWQPYHSRLLSTIFAISVPFIVYVISITTSLVEKGLRIFILLILLVITPKYFSLNEAKPLQNIRQLGKKNRLELTFIKQPHLYVNYKKTIELINQSNCKNVGIIMGYEDWGYPLLKSIDPTKFVYQIDVNNNVSGKLQPTTILCLKIKIDNTKNVCEVIN